MTAETGRSLELWAHEAEAAAGIARALAGTAFIPDSLKIYDQRRNFDLDATVAQTAAALLTGQELGLSPMASLRSIDIIPPGSGSPALRANALRGLLQQHGHDLWVEETTDTRAVVAGRRSGDETVQRSIWTIDRARKMELRGFNDPKGSWRRQPAAMLVARATAEMARWIASDAILGLPYITEEIQDLPENGDGAPSLGGGSIQPPATRGDVSAARPATRRRKSRAPVASLPSGSALPPPQGDPDGNGQPAAPPARIGAGQRAALWAGLKRLGLTGRNDALAAVSGWVGREISSSNDLTEEEASRALGALASEEERRAATSAQDQAAELSEPPPEEPA